MNITTKDLNAAVARLSNITGQELEYVAHQSRSHNHRVAFKDKSKHDLLSGKTKSELMDLIDAFITGFYFTRNNTQQ